GTCALLCAASGGGKSTLTAAMMRQGWNSLGDDKLLLRINDGKSEVAALLHTFNLHPKTSQWFPEVGELERLPTYSIWTEKRKVRMSDIWPGRIATQGSPTHLVLLDRKVEFTGIEVDPLPPAEIFSTLLRQVVIPKDRVSAGAIVSAILTTAKTLRGVRVRIGKDAYHDAKCIRTLEAALL
ncbi:MAG: hypothetical protein M3007_05795, partial [Candidatus Eremiobacteraeota bacterium]|nr:hypothetical protein [Candidatus Eremiobacteraeota bacterium]